MEPSNLLKIETLDCRWRDKDSVILHACFQLLKDCVEKENLLDGHVIWDEDEKHKLVKKEIDELYQWWLSYKEPDTLTSNSYEKENEMLIRLIEIRWALWT
ncbi:MAG: hypothetical protein JKX98_10960 [Alcanivoracaceae bacterium]|nr:hypothetical protein [Alcanivoracaceae bacterium]